ncbi:capsid protein [Bacillus pseudomycoides]|uniref:phage tail tube protein n=1 Tax=Bacillus pseudomycoides TaxID=64104 RepID=UPI000BFE37AE|nr:capsid protein [Bacillus pseudomycoides]PHB11468.1 capsid protein [Bacillus pseudomycoides]
MAYLLNHLYKFEINTGTKATPKWAVIAKGITSVDPDNNEEVEEDYYYDGGGASERSVVGFMMSYGFEGHRAYGDEAQDFIFKKINQIGDARKTDFRVTEPSGDKWEGPATISEIKAPGGDANSKGEVEFNIAFDGAPELTEKASA